MSSNDYTEVTGTVKSVNGCCVQSTAVMVADDWQDDVPLQVSGTKETSLLYKAHREGLKVKVRIGGYVFGYLVHNVELAP